MASYAYGGSAGAPDTLDETGATEHHYPQPGAIGLEFAKPRPAHTLTPEAEEARQGAIAYGREQLLNDAVARIVTDHGTPHVEPYHGPTPAAAKRLEAKAAAAGMTTTITTTITGCVVEAIDRERGVAFRAWYVRGKADGGTWHEREDRWILTRDERAVKVNALTRTGLAGYRTAGMSETRLKLVASRAGLPVNVTEIERRLSEL